MVVREQIKWCTNGKNSGSVKNEQGPSDSVLCCIRMPFSL